MGDLVELTLDTEIPNIEASFDTREPDIEADFQINVSNTDHDLLRNRDIPNQHPMSAITGLESALDGKQDTLTAGDNIQIENGVISATDTTYTAGDGISIENGIISNTQTSAEWGNITGTLSDQTDLNNALGDLSGGIDSNHQAISNHVSDKNNPHEVTKSQVGLGNVDNTSDLNKPISTATQTALNGKADKATTYTKTEVDNALSGKQDNLSMAQLSAVNSGIDSTKVAQIATNTNDISTINSKIPSAASSSNQLADKSYVDDAIQINSAHFRGNWATWDDVPTDVNDYPADDDGNKTPTVNDYMVVQDSSDYTSETLEGTWQFTYTGLWSINGKNGWFPRFQINETPFTQAQLDAINSGATSTNIGQIATNTGEISSLQSGKADKATTLAGYGITDAYTKTEVDTALSGYATESWVGQQGYLTGITSSDVTSALGYTPYNSTNPNGYQANVIETVKVNGTALTPTNKAVDITVPSAVTEATVSGWGFTKNVGTVTSVNNTQPDANGNVAITIPTVNNATLTITQGGTTKGTFSANASSDVTIALDAGGGSSYTAGTGIDITNGVISVASPTLTNTATGTNSITIEGTAATGIQSVNIGVGSSTLRSSVAIGYNTTNTGTYNVCIGSYSSCSVILGYGVALGYGSNSNAKFAIQIGYGTNSEANSFYVSTSDSNNWKMLGSDGKIPSGRLPIATSVSSSSTNAETVGAKLFYDTCGDIETLINAL